MVWYKRSSHTDLEDLLTNLPEGFVNVAVGLTQFIWGPTGAFVVLIDDERPDRARQLGRLAATVRSALAEHLPLVPYVHALLVSHDQGESAHASIVPPTMLMDVIQNAPTSLSPPDRRHIQRAVRGGALRGLEAVAPTAGGARMHGWPSPPATTSSSRSTTSVAKGARSSAAMPPGSTGSSGAPSPGA